VAREAIEAGADIVNDVSGGTHDPEMLSCVAKLGVPMILMHMRGNPKTMQSLTNYTKNVGQDENNGVLSGVVSELMDRSKAAEDAGIPRWLQVLDPGIGFAKDVDGNLTLLKGSGALRTHCNNMPFLFGPSRKGFIGKVTGETDPAERDFGTIAACLVCTENKEEIPDTCNILRVHNVKAVKQAVLTYEAIQKARLE
jgi:dihydropteroate synthase